MIVGGVERPTSGYRLEHAPKYFERPPRKETRAVVLHWTGAERPPLAMAQSLRSRGLSVNFAVDAGGVVWQLADVDAHCFHCRGANAWTVGIELVNRATTQRRIGPERPKLRETIHGKVVRYRGFTAEQLDAARALTRQLCTLYNLPVRAPHHSDGSVYSTQLPSHALQMWRGVLGHLHVHPSKCDPGLQLLAYVEQVANVA